MQSRSSTCFIVSIQASQLERNVADRFLQWRIFLAGLFLEQPSEGLSKVLNQVLSDLSSIVVSHNRKIMCHAYFAVFSPLSNVRQKMTILHFSSK